MAFWAKVRADERPSVGSLGSGSGHPVENNRNLPVEAKTRKLTYAEAARASRVVRLQNEMISDGQAPDGEALERCKAYALKKETIQFH